MKELEKTKRISIAAVLTILVVLIALLSYKRPKHMYDLNTKETLTKVTSTDFLLNMDNLDLDNQILIDIRNRFDYDRGHMENAINMHIPEILDDQNTSQLNDYKNTNKTIVLYGNSPSQAMMPFMLLTQLGFDNVKILSVALDYSQNKLIVTDTIPEKNVADVTGFIEESVKKTEEIMAKARKDAKAKTYVKPEPVSTPKQVVPKKKKKKMPVEGGC